MNLRGKVISKYLNEKTEKFKNLQKGRYDSIGYQHNDRMNRLLILSFVLANKQKIDKIAKEAYTKLLSPSDVVGSFYQREINGFFSACCLEMGFEVTTKDIEKGCILDYDLYITTLDKELLIEVQKIFNRIDTQTLSLF